MQFTEPQQESLVSYAVFDVPTSEKVAQLLEDGKYEKFDPQDFFALQVQFISELIDKGEGDHYVTNYLKIEPGDENDLEKVSSLIREGAPFNFMFWPTEEKLGLDPLPLEKIGFGDAVPITFTENFRTPPARATGKIEIALGTKVAGSMPVAFLAP